MEDGYSMNDYIEIQTLYDPNQIPISSATFDPQQELLWMGNSEGRVSSYYGLSLSKYTSFKVQNDSDIRAIYACRDRDAVFFLNEDMISSYTRFGVNIFKHKEASFQNLQCMYFNQQGRFYLGGYTDTIFDFDIERLRVLRQLRIDEKDCILMKYSNRGSYVCTGSVNGQINIRDPFSLKSIKQLNPHNGSLSDFDVHGNYLVSCGFSQRHNSLCVDRFLMVYDLRMMAVMNPIQLLIEPSFVHYLPMCSSVLIVASQSGCFQLTDTNVSTSTSYYQVYQAQVAPMGLCTTFSVSDTCQVVAFGHSTGSIHLFSKGENPQFNAYSIPTTFVDPIPAMNPFIDINHEMSSLSGIPVPVPEETSISDWPKEWCTYEYRPSLPIEEDLLNNARIIHGIASIPNRSNIKRNTDFKEQYKNALNKLKDHINTTSCTLHELNELNSKKDEKKVSNNSTQNIKATVSAIIANTNTHTNSTTTTTSNSTTTSNTNATASKTQNDQNKVENNNNINKDDKIESKKEEQQDSNDEKQKEDEKQNEEKSSETSDEKDKKEKESEIEKPTN